MINMRTLLTIFFVTLASQVFASDYEVTFKCRGESQVDWGVKAGFTSTPKDEINDT